MLYLKELPISDTTRKKLEELSDIIKASNTLDKKNVANELWRNRTNNAAFAEIRENLAQMCFGIERCNYCEDAAAHTIEHILPKSIYPEMTFAWDNFLFICGSCNSFKNDKFPVFLSDTKFEYSTPENPLVGDPVYINPRQDDPCEYIELDLLSFQFVEIDDNENDRKYLRAKKSIDDFSLNVRGNKGELLITQRKLAFHTFQKYLSDYNINKSKWGENERIEFINLFKKLPHPTVWFEIKRYYNLYPVFLKTRYPELYTILESNTEILEW